MPPSTIPSIFNDILSPDPRCENSEPKLPRNGKALSQPHDAWPVLALGAYLLRCRDKAPLLHPALSATYQRAGVAGNHQVLIGLYHMGGDTALGRADLRPVIAVGRLVEFQA